MNLTAFVMYLMMGTALSQGLNQYNNRQDFYNNYSNPIIPYCIFGNEPVCSTEN